MLASGRCKLAKKLNLSELGEECCGEESCDGEELDEFCGEITEEYNDDDDGMILN